jgi:peroxiredoxin
LTLALAFGAAGCDGSGTDDSASTLQPGSRRPALSLFDLNGRARDLSEWDGQVLLVNFWATWCPPCRAEIPDFIEVRDRFRDQAFEVIGIAVDRPDLVRDYAARLAIPYPILLDSLEGGSSLGPWGNPDGALPYSVLIARDGRVALTHRGKLSSRHLEDHLAGLL